MIFANILLLALLFFIIRAFFQLVTLLGTIHYTAALAKQHSDAT